MSGQTCAEVAHDTPWLCYEEPEASRCCESCRRISDAVGNPGSCGEFSGTESRATWAFHFCDLQTVVRGEGLKRPE